MKSASGKYVGTDILPTLEITHGARGTPIFTSLQLVLEKTPPLIQQSVITHVGLDNSPYGLEKLNMPIGKIGIVTGERPECLVTPRQVMT